MSDYKQLILNEFEVLRSVSLLEAGGSVKERAYTAAQKAIQMLPVVRSMEDLPSTVKGSGLSKDMRKKIEYIMLNGHLDISPAIRATSKSLAMLQGVYGIGPKKAQELIQAGFTTIEQLRASPHLLNKNQRIGVVYYDDLLQRIPRAEMDVHAALLMRCKPAALEGMIVGSYRRGKPDSGDIDMLIRTASPGVDAGVALTEFVRLLQREGYLIEVLAHGVHKCMGISRIAGGVGRRLDLLVTPPAEFPFAVFYFTGCDTFNVAVRSHALRKGYTLNEHTLTELATGTHVTGLLREEDIFAFLGLRWVPPEERTGPDAVIAL